MEDDQVVPGHQDLSSQTSPQVSPEDDSLVQLPLMTSTPQTQERNDSGDHRDSGYTSPPIGNTLGPNSPEQTDIDGRMIQRFSFSEDTHTEDTQDTGDTHSELSEEEEDSAFMESSHVDVLLAHQDSQEYLDTGQAYSTVQSMESGDTHVQGHMLPGPDRGANPNDIHTEGYVQGHMLQRQDINHNPDNLDVEGHVEGHGLLEGLRGYHYNTPPPSDEFSDQAIGDYSPHNILHSEHRTVELSSSYAGHTDTEHPLFTLSYSPQGQGLQGVTAAIPVPRSQSNHPPHLSRYNNETSVFHTPPRQYILRHASTTPSLLAHQGGANSPSNQTTGARSRTEGAGKARRSGLSATEHPAPAPRSRFYSEHQPPTDLPDGAHETNSGSHGDRRRSAPAVMYTAQLFGQELRRIGDEFEGSYSQPLQEEQPPVQMRVQDQHVHPRRDSNRRSFPGANHQQTRWWEKIIQLLPVYQPNQPIGRHRTEPGPLCGRLTEENSEEEGESDETTDCQTEL